MDIRFFQSFDEMPTDNRTPGCDGINDLLSVKFRGDNGGIWVDLREWIVEHYRGPTPISVLCFQEVRH